LRLTLLLSVLFALPVSAQTILPLKGVVDDDSVAPLIESIKKGPTAIVIDSPGGSVSAALDLIQAMEISAYPTVCVVDGLAASAAALIFESCSYRIFLKTSILMFHDPSFVLPGDTSLNGPAVQKMGEELRVLSTALEARVCRRTNLTWNECRAKIKADWWLDFEDVERFGLADRVE
jgi:ATP-dependent protease ClpP protease subunit